MKVMQFFEVNLIIGICQDNDLFTAGTNEEFCGLYKWNNKPYTDESLFEIAKYIKKYSSNVMAVHDIAGTILRDGVIRYIDSED